MSKIYWAIAALGIFGLPATVAAQHDDHGGECDPYVQPILSVADVNADGAVDSSDVQAVISHMARRGGDYHPLYDLNADGRIDGRDVASASRDIGDPVPLQDTQLATAALETMDFYGPGGMQRAMIAGYIPFTPFFAGHGAHLLNFTKIYYDEFDVANVPGLNYDEHGNLVAVFYIRTIARDMTGTYPGLFPDLADDHPPMTSFDGVMHHDWHNHQSIWITGLGSTNPQDVTFQQHLPVPEVLCRIESIGGSGNLFPNSHHMYSPKFYMLHAWVHKINTCGVFAGTDPTVAIGFPDEHLATWDPDDSWCY